MLKGMLRILSGTCGLALMGALALATLPRAADALTIYTDRAAWLTAVGVGPITDENFDDGMANGFSLTFGGSPHTSLVAGFNSPGIFNMQLQDVLLADDANSTTFDFDAPIRAFGADWNLFGPGGAGVGIQVAIGGMLLGGQVSNVLGNPASTLAASPNGGFFGFINSDLFSEMTLTGGTQGTNQSRETYSLDNAAFSPVPEPNAVLVFGSGLVVTGLAMRRRPR